MPTPNENGPPKKPTPPPAPGAKPGAPQAKPQAAAPGATPAKPQAPAPGAKPAAPQAKPQPASGQAPAQKPAAAGGVPAKPAPPGAKPAPPGPKPPVPGGKPAPPKPAGAAPGAKPQAGAKPPVGGKPAPKDAKGAAAKDKDHARGSGGGRRLGQVLVDLGFIDEEQLFALIEESKDGGAQLGQTVLARGLITEVQLFQALGDQHGLKVLTPEELKPTPEALQLVPEPMSSVYKVLPLSFTDAVLTVVISDPTNMQSLDDLRTFLGIKEVKANLAPPSAVSDVLAKCYLGKEESIIDIINSLQTDEELISTKSEASIDLESLMEIQDAAPVRKLLNMVLLLAIKDRASDIHFEPFEEEYKMRYRCDGILYEMVPPPRHLAMAISTRIKVMANLDIAERRLPQDGRIELNVGGNPVDMRVSILPTMFGESCVIRVLDRGAIGLDLGRIGLEPTMLAQFREIIRKPNGIILVTGPTGSGKTTTLYSALNELNEITEKIITTEDPIEYDIDGIVQCPINSEIGVTFAGALRAILRQDPDKILVGEIRDLETAQIAVQSALTGHMVFSTLHTNDAPSTITRLRDMGLETFLITASLEAVLAQRLVRRICEDCRTPFEPSPEILMELNLRPGDVVGKKFFYGKGCDRCNNTGFKGRVGLFELIIVNDEIRDLISAGASTDKLREACRKSGMTTLRESGLRAIYSGVSTIDEVVHETVMEDEA